MSVILHALTIKQQVEEQRLLQQVALLKRQIEQAIHQKNQLKASALQAALPCKQLVPEIEQAKALYIEQKQLQMSQIDEGIEALHTQTIALSAKERKVRQQRRLLEKQKVLHHQKARLTQALATQHRLDEWALFTHNRSHPLSDKKLGVPHD